MTLDNAVDAVRKDFPFEGYTEPQVDAYRNIARTVLRHLPGGSSILDFGCGPCDKTAVLQLLGYRCTGFDDLADDWHTMDGNKEKILAFASGMGIDLRVIPRGSLPFEKESFDMVMLHDVLEHLHDSPRELMNSLVDLVKTGGYLFVTVPSAVNIRKRLDVLFGRTNFPRFEGYYWTPGEWRGHIREYTRGDLESLSHFLGLKTVELRSCNNMLHKVPSALQPAYIGITSIFTGWRDSWLLIAKKESGWKPRRELPGDVLNKVLQQSTAYRYDK